jgi:two-component system, chemotaxis family, CheB/CheR fusion protein
MSTLQQDTDFEELLEFLRAVRGFDFTGYKRSSLRRRTIKRMQEVGIESYPDYLRRLQTDPDEFEALFNTILINVTSFFRDAEAWTLLGSQVVPELIGRTPDPIRIWSAGCASGQEAYSVAMLFAEALGASDINGRIKIYATDIDEEALTEGRHAAYDERAVQHVPDALRARYFDRVGNRYTIRSDLRRAVIFGRHNLAKDAPISRIDLLLCRNTLMYFSSALQARIMAAFHFALQPKGYLVLGKSEMMLSRSDRFEAFSLRRRVFRPLKPDERYDRSLAMESGRGTGDHRAAVAAALQGRAFEHAEIAQLVLDPERRLVVANRRARELFTIDDDDAGKPIQDFDLSYKPVELRSRIDEAEADGQPVVVREVNWAQDGAVRLWDVTIAPLTDGESPLGTLVAFVDVTRFRGLEQELERSRREVQAAYEELQSTVEELETTNEELQSTNEELETTNEELQSTNEELETMNEELQSTNEELETMNDELRMRSTELNRVNFFFETVLLSLEVAVIVTDAELHVQVWNNESENLWGLRSPEVVGQHLLNLDVGLPVGELRAPTRACLTGASAREELRLEAVNRRGRAITCAVTLLPLADGDEIRGVVILIESQAAQT